MEIDLEVTRHSSKIDRDKIFLKVDFRDKYDGDGDSKLFGFSNNPSLELLKSKTVFISLCRGFYDSHP